MRLFRLRLPAVMARRLAALATVSAALSAALSGALSAALVVAPVPALAATPASGSEVQAATGSGWQEALVHVADPAPFVAFLTRDAGWRVLHEGRIPQPMLAAWGLAQPGQQVRGREVLLANPGDAKGWVRLVTLEGVASEPIRPAAQAWDPGGWYSIMTRSRDATAIYRAAIARGWSAANTPQEFTFGGVRLRNVVIRGPDGVNFAVYERISPLLEGWPTIQGVSRGFNAMTMVADFEAERRFFQDGLGFGAWFIGPYEDTGPTPTNFGLPVNLAPQVPRRSGILWEQPGEDGRVEIMRFEGLDGVDQSARASFANRGIVSVRIPVASLSAWTARAQAAGITVHTTPEPVVIRPYGPVRHAWVRSPGGAIVEAFEQLP
jgi:catechol 2,3-dioxygenase-like lactoylglutathione lyase family enzyme